MLYLLVGIVILGLIAVFKILAPEMLKTSNYRVRRVNPEAELDQLLKTTLPQKGTEKLEILLAEKNRNISLLERELKILQSQEQSFNKVKVLMLEEIQRLKEQNRIFRSELGLPTMKPHENSIT